MFLGRKYILFLVLIGAITFFNSLNNSFLGDDEDQIINNPQINKISNIPKLFTGSTYFREETGQSYGLFYRPMMMTVYTIIYSIFHSDPLFFHLFQLIIHITNSIIIYSIFRYFFNDFLSFILAIVFLVHPINSEVVLYIADLQDALFMLFGLYAFLLILKDKKSKNINISHLIFISILLLFSCFSKETGLLFIPLILSYVLLFARKKIKLYSESFFIVGLMYFFFRSFAGSSMNREWFTPIGLLPIGKRLINTPKIILTYLLTFIFPKDLSLNQVWLVKSLVDPNFYIPLLLLIILFLLWLKGLLALIRKYSQYIHIYSFFSLWLLLGLIFHSQIIVLELTYDDRWFYFPIVGLIGIIGIFTQVSKSFFSKHKVGSMVGIGFIIVFLCIRTVMRTYDFYDAETLFSHDLKVVGKNFYLANSLASIYINNGDYDKARPYEELSISEFSYFGNLNNMALIYANDKKYEKADEYFLKAINSRGNYMVYQNYSNFLIFIKNDLNSAKDFTIKSIKVYPKSPKLLINLSYIYYQMNDKAEALYLVRQANILNPKIETSVIIEKIKNDQQITFEDLQSL
jgi:protein O-mannosyl-transferase